MEIKNWKQSYGAPKRTSRYGFHHFWVMSYGNRVMSYGNWWSKQPLSFFIFPIHCVWFSKYMCALTLFLLINEYRYNGQLWEVHPLWRKSGKHDQACSRNPWLHYHYGSEEKKKRKKSHIILPREMACKE